MEHPLITNLEHLSVDELNTKISELHKKLTIAYRSGNGYVCDQIRMALESYQAMYDQKTRKGPSPFDDVIDIS
jgi:hypothetical protein